MFDHRWLWWFFALLAMACVPTVTIASTAMDLMVLYLIPLQLVVWARFPVFLQGHTSRTFAFSMIGVFYAIVRFTHLTYGKFVDALQSYGYLLFHIFRMSRKVGLVSYTLQCLLMREVSLDATDH